MTTKNSKKVVAKKKTRKTSKKKAGYSKKTTSGRKKSSVKDKTGRKETSEPSRKRSKMLAGVEPTRGRFQMFDIKELSAPFSDPDGRTFVACTYADGTKRIYSLATIVKNRDTLSRILGSSAMTRAIGTL